jgi:tripartite-type tricarboxylate transporter receptor subunit TctC
VIGVRDAGSASLFVVPIVAALLGIEYELVTGYVGNTARALAAIRGDVDLLVQNLDSVQRFIADGELRPLLQVTGDRLDGVPVLAGEQGVAGQRAAQTGRAREQALRQAGALAVIMNAGRLIVAPPGLSAGLRRCLEVEIGSLLNDPGLRADAARARLSIEPADAATARAEVIAAKAAIVEVAPLVRSAMQRARR